ncbi:MAG: ribosome-associated translation inhibitor RaiA [Pseudomonadota bacterium]
MQITVRGHQMDVGESLTTHVEDTLGEIADKYFDHAIEAQVVFSPDAHLIQCGVTAHVMRGLTLRCEASAPQPYAAFDAAADKMAKRLRRHKRRLRDHHLNASQDAALKAPYYVLSGEDDLDDETANGETQNGAPLVIAEMETDIGELTVQEAVMRLDFDGDKPAVLFRNKAHGGLNLVYRRPDGNVGWIDPR